MAKFNLLIGADPEFFIEDKKGNLVCPANIIPGSKVNPVQLLGLPNGCMQQVDGMAVEFNIPAAQSRDYFSNYVTQTRDFLFTTLSTKGYKVRHTPIATFSEEVLRSAPIENQRLGCDPDYNAYTGMTNPRPDEYSLMRAAGGHIHLGWTKDKDPFNEVHFSDCCAVVKQLDYYLGLYSLLWDKDKERRKFYGKAGAFRPKTYGLEYRVLSNEWLFHKKLPYWIASTTSYAFNQLVSAVPNCFEKFGNFAREQIDNCNEKWAEMGLLGEDIRNSIGIESPRKYLDQ